MNRKQAVSLVVRIGLSALMLGVLIWRIPPIDLDEVLPPLDARTVAWLSVAMLLTLVALLLSAVRWLRVCDVLGLPAKLKRLVNHCLAGHFVSNVLPGTIGGDVLRVARLSRETGETPKTFASVVLERLTGWLVLPLISVIGFLVNPPLRDLGRATQVALGLAFATLMALCILLYAVADQRIGGRFEAKEGWRRFASAVHLGLAQMKHEKAATANVLFVGFAYQLVLVLAAVAAAQALGVRPAGLTALLAFFPAVAIAQVLPIGISGLGVREGAFVLFLGPLGVDAQDAVALGLLLYLLNLGVSLLGAPAFVVGGRLPSLIPPFQPDIDSVMEVEPNAEVRDDRAGLRWWKEVLLAAGVYFVYSVVRNQFGSAGGDPGPAYGHAVDIIELQRTLHLYFEPYVQEWYLDLPANGLIRLWNVYYGVAHFLVTLIALVWMFRRDPLRHRLLRNTLVLMTCLAVIGFAAYSLMPPRLLDDPGRYGGCQIYNPDAAAAAEPGALTAPGCDEYGFVDTVATYGGWISFGSEEYEEVSNQYAAMPSMHIGWATWTAIVLLGLVRRPWARGLAIAYPVLTLVCIVLTANHYWIDGLGGLVCLAAGYVLARLITHPVPTTAPATA